MFVMPIFAQRSLILKTFAFESSLTKTANFSVLEDCVFSTLIYETIISLVALLKLLLTAIPAFSSVDLVFEP